MSNESRLRELMEQWLASLTRGQNPSAAELCGSHVDLIQPLEQRILDERKKGNLPEPQSATSSTVNQVADPYETRTFDPDQSPSNPDHLPGVGKSFAGFQLLSVLGEGGFGTVFRAEDTVLRRKVALKVLHSRALARADAQETFLAEARALASIQHDHVVPIFQVGRQNGQLFLAMPLLGGETLASRIERVGALPIDEVCRIGREVASGLAAIHAKRLVHRDLKPGNIWLEADTGRAKVLDLGLALDPRATEKQLAGTPAYMSPEQAEGRELDFRSDLFSLGTVLYECATGGRPFRGDSLVETLNSVVTEIPAPVQRANPAIPSEVAMVIEKLHSKNPNDRFASATAVNASLSLGTSSCTPAPSAHERRRSWWPFSQKITIVIAVLIGLAMASVAVISRMQDRNSTMPEERKVPVSPALGLGIDQFEIELFQPVGEKKYESRGTLGDRGGVFHGLTSDAITIRAKLSRPAYCFLIAFQPDGAVRGLFPQDETAESQKTDQPAYPTTRPSSKWGLDDGNGGLWVVALVASEEPLPTFEKWRTAHNPIPWRRYASPIRDQVLRDDQLLEAFIPGKPGKGVDRSEKTDENVEPIVNLTQWLRGKTTGRVAAIAFSVVKD